MPKFTSRNEFICQPGMSIPESVDGKTLATLILAPGEYTQPLPISQPTEPPYHLPISDGDNKKLNEIMRRISAVYFCPYGWTPALRLELPGAIVQSLSRLAIVLEGITRQFFSPAVFEPYPLFLADRMVKSLGAGVGVVEQAVAQQVAGTTVDIETALLFLQNYRTEGGRGDIQ